MEIQKEWLETIMRRHAEEEIIARVISAEQNSVVPAGENYTSEMIRVKMKVVLRSGQIVNRSVIVKGKTDEDNPKSTFTSKYPLFRNEINMYTVILPQMKSLMRRNGDLRETLWCECFGHSGEKTIVLEDLKESGFQLADRFNGQDLQHALITLQSLGRFHAMTHVLYKQGVLDPNCFDEYLVARNDDVMKKMINASLTTLVDVIRSTWSSEWETVANKLEGIQDTLQNDVKELLQAPDNVFKVLNHGDCWTNNMMFKYDLLTKNPIMLKFVDLQAPHFNSFVWDIVYFLSTSVRWDVRDVHLDELLEAYRMSVVATLEILGEVDANGLLGDLAAVKAEVGRLAKFSLLLILAVTPIMMAPPTDPWDLGSVLEDEEVDLKKNRNIFCNEKYKALLQHDIKHFTAAGVL